SEVGGSLDDEEKPMDGRVQKECPEMEFQYPVRLRGSKLSHVKKVLEEGGNISATHSLFANMDAECIDLLKGRKNVLVIDEELEAYEAFEDISKDSIRHKKITGEITFDEETGKLSWEHERFPLKSKDYEFSSFVRLCD